MHDRKTEINKENNIYSIFREPGSRPVQTKYKEKKARPTAAASADPAGRPEAGNGPPPRP